MKNENYVDKFFSGLMTVDELMGSLDEEKAEERRLAELDEEKKH